MNKRPQNLHFAGTGRRTCTLGRALLFGLALGAFFNSQPQDGTDKNRGLQDLVASEELTLQLTDRLKGLNKSVMNLALPDHQSRDLFEDSLKLVDLSPDAEKETEELSATASLQMVKWGISDEAKALPFSKLSMWRPLLDKVDYFERAGFNIKKSHFLNDAQSEFETELLFDGVASTDSGKLSTVKARQVVRWRKHAAGSEEEASLWRIYDWRMTSFETIKTSRKLFTEVLEQVLAADQQTLRRARDSKFTEYFRQFLQSQREGTTFYIPDRSFKFDQKNIGVSVVDLDRDGFDDFYVVDPWSENMFFHNRGDGTFEEVAAELGINIGDYTTSALFADFDNDGDTDLFLGRSIRRALYFENENGRFVDRTEDRFDVILPKWSFGITTVDYNSDGLLDIYVSTARNLEHIEAEWLTPGNNYDKKMPVNIGAANWQKMRKLLQSKDAHAFVNKIGVPNVMLKNLGNGRFAIPEESPELGVFRETLQSAWSDFDDDGDPDVYLVNDFGPNNLLRNDGNGRFVDVTEQTGTTDIGNGMGVTWGDYDNDGRQDLYVTNMYSKAGKRITASIPYLDERFTKSAQGNSLLRNLSGAFERVSGAEPPALAVTTGGWGWGSQFVDIDNDGYLDIYALSGYITVPKEFDRGIDL